MATPIAPTPTLKGKAAKKFLDELENLKKQKEQKVFDFEEMKKMYKDDIAKLQIYTTIGEE